jgi:hypothetical protein
MGMKIDKAWADNMAGRVNFAPTAAFDLADDTDQATVYGHISREGLRASAIDNRAAANNDIMIHLGPPVCLLLVCGKSSRGEAGRTDLGMFIFGRP